MPKILILNDFLHLAEVGISQARIFI